MTSQPRDLHGEKAERNMDIAIHVLQEIHVPIRACRIGGGTNLASYWRHRISTDIDVFASFADVMQAIDNLGGPGKDHPMLKRLLHEAGATNILKAVVQTHGIFWQTRDGAEGSLYPQSVAPPEQQIAFHRRSSMPFENKESILMTKVGGRINHSRKYMDRDLFDLIAAAEKDSEILIQTFDSSGSSLGSPLICRRAAELIKILLDSDPAWAGTPDSTNRRIIDPYRKDLYGRRLWEEGHRLLSEGPREYVQRLRNKQRRDKGWSR